MDIASATGRARLVNAPPRREAPYPGGLPTPQAAVTAKPAHRSHTRSRTRTAALGEACWVLAVDATVLVAVSFAAGSTWPVTLLRTLITATALAVVGLYRPRLDPSALDDAPRVLLAVVAVLPLAGWIAVPTLATPPALGAAPVAWPALLIAALVIGRALVYVLLRRRRRHRPGEASVVLGTGDVAIRLVEALRRYPAYGLTPVGFVGPAPITGSPLPAPLLGTAETLADIVAEHRPRHLIVAFADAPDADLVSALRSCRSRGVTVFTVPRLFELPLGRTRAELVEGIPLIRLQPESRGLRRRAVKRLIDIVGAAIGLLLLSPVLAACALAVRLESGRHRVIFRQIRIGQDGRPFTILKFRSLTPATVQESRMRWNINSDARLGPVGKVLRLTSLDELPQLLNVLRGDMSLVGPRPERPFFVEQFERTYAGYPDRHRMPSGITGWAQIHGLRGDTSISERVRFDNFYIENWSVALDLKILLRTAGSMLSISRR